MSQNESKPRRPEGRFETTCRRRWDEKKGDERREGVMRRNEISCGIGGGRLKYMGR